MTSTNETTSITQSKVAIITVTYNSSGFIHDYLDAIQPFLIQDKHQLIIVDNNSSDNTCSDIESYADTHKLREHIDIIPSRENLGFGKGCNRGAEAAETYKPDYLWFLNPDTQVLPNSGSELLSFLENNTTAHFAGSILLNEQQEERPGAFRFPGIINTALSTMQLGLLDRALPQYTTAEPIQSKPYPADWLTGASFMVHSKCFSTLKGFDPYYFLYFEEVDLFFRAKKSGFHAFTCPASKVIHISGASTGINTREQRNQRSKRQPSYWFESRRHFYTSNYSTAYLSAVDTVFFICHAIWLLRATIQQKTVTTPMNFATDILKHGYLTSIRKWLRIDKA